MPRTTSIIPQICCFHPGKLTLLHSGVLWDSENHEGTVTAIHCDYSLCVPSKSSLCVTWLFPKFSLVNTHFKLSKNLVYCSPPPALSVYLKKNSMPGLSCPLIFCRRGSCHTLRIKPFPKTHVIDSEKTSELSDSGHGFGCQTAVETRSSVGLSWCLLHMVFVRSHPSVNVGFLRGGLPKLRGAKRP